MNTDNMWKLRCFGVAVQGAFVSLAGDVHSALLSPLLLTPREDLWKFWRKGREKTTEFLQGKNQEVGKWEIFPKGGLRFVCSVPLNMLCTK